MMAAYVVIQYGTPMDVDVYPYLVQFASIPSAASLSRLS